MAANDHRADEGSKFCRQYGLDRLVYAEEHPDIHAANMREKALKAWKIELIERSTLAGTNSLAPR